MSRFAILCQLAAVSYAAFAACTVAVIATEKTRPGASADNGEPQNRALLIGCTRYPKGIPALEGPGNDVPLVQKLLAGTFGFDDIVILSEAAAGEEPPAAEKRPELRPTRANIAHQFAELAKRARKDDQVFILMGGHGTQQPDRSGDEHDGLDEIFLPADVGDWDPSTGGLANAITDDDIRQWVNAIGETGASVCVMFDACQSGTLLRGTDDEVPRTVDAVPEKELAKARAAAAKRFGAAPSDPTLAFAKLDSLKGNIVGIYAARSDEPEVETKLPADDGTRKYYGLLTYNVCQVLTPKEDGTVPPMTYRELVQRVQQLYAQDGRQTPIPLVEGPTIDRRVFGLETWPARLQFVLDTSEKPWRVNAGLLHGVTQNSILAVYPPVGSPSEEAVGYVKVQKAGAGESIVEPCAYEDKPQVTHLPNRGRCEPAYVDFGELRLKVAVEDVVGNDASAETARSVVESLKQLNEEENSLVQLTGDAASANWRVQVDKDGVYLVPRGGVSVRHDNSRTAEFRVESDDAGHLVGESLARIARAEMLKTIAKPQATAVAGSPSRVKITTEILKFKDAEDQQPAVEQYRTGLQLKEGDIIAFRVNNLAGSPKIYVTLLFIDSQYGIDALYPGLGEVAEAVNPGNSLVTQQLTVNADTVGAEHLVVIAVKASGPPVDFTGLAQPRLERSRAVALTRGANDVMQTPAGKLLENALYGEGEVRGLNTRDIQDFAVNLLDWETVPAEGKQDGR